MHVGLLNLFARDDTSAIIAAALVKIKAELIAPLFLGLIFNFLLWGVSITQCYYYYKSYRNTDRRWLKAAVGLLFTVDALESICAAMACWVFMVDGWGDLTEAVTYPGWALYTTPITDSFTAVIVHCFYAQKIWTLLDPPYNRIATAFVLVLTTTQFVGAIGGSALIYSQRITLAAFNRFETWATVWLVTASVTDIVITVIMTWKLSRSRTGFKKTDDIISKLIRLTVETGLATAIVQIVDIVTYLIWPIKAFHMVPALTAPKVYSNSMLALLNSRQPRKPTGLVWDSHQDTADSIHIHTSRTVAVTEDYELSGKQKLGGTNSTSQINSQHPLQKAPDFVTTD